MEKEEEADDEGEQKEEAQVEEKEEKEVVMGRLMTINWELDVDLLLISFLIGHHPVTFISFGTSAAQKQALLLPHTHTNGNNIPFDAEERICRSREKRRVREKKLVSGSANKTVNAVNTFRRKSVSREN